MCLKTEEKFLTNSSFAPLTKDRVKDGKTAMAKEAPIIPMGKYWRLLAKLKIEIEPTAKVEAIAVMTIRFICRPAIARVRGIINKKTLLIPDSFKLKIGWYFKPQFIAEGIWIMKCKKAPKITPIITPKTENWGAKNKMPKIIPRLYKIGERL